jgi:hypothetical protein
MGGLWFGDSSELVKHSHARDSIETKVKGRLVATCLLLLGPSTARLTISPLVRSPSLSKSFPSRASPTNSTTEPKSRTFGPDGKPAKYSNI